MGYSTPKKPFDLKEFLAKSTEPRSARGSRRFRSSVYTIRKSAKDDTQKDKEAS